MKACVPLSTPTPHGLCCCSHLQFGTWKAYVAVAGLEGVWGLAGGPCRAGTCLGMAASIPPCLQEADMKQVLSPVIATAYVISLSDPRAAVCAKQSIFPLPTLPMHHAGKHMNWLFFLSCVHGISIRFWRQDCWKQAAKVCLGTTVCETGL